MVRVCCDWFPNEKNSNKAGFYMDDILKANLDALLRNAHKKDDWDFCIAITGGGRVRVGKSVLALQISIYWVYELERLYGLNIPFSIKENIIFTGSKLIKQGNYLGTKYPQSVLMFDEAGADLQSTKVLRSSTQQVKDFMRECGQYNFLIVLVMPEFFDLPKGIALSRCDFLINCYVSAKTGKFQRGFFNFYSRSNKKKLYLYGKKELNYKAYKYNFHGRFYNFYPIDEQEYRKSKIEALKEREYDRVTQKHITQRNVLLEFCDEKGYSQTEMANFMQKKGISLTKQAISLILQESKDKID